jgi:hypothetical protein
MRKSDASQTESIDGRMLRGHAIAVGRRDLVALTFRLSMRCRKR